MKALDSLLSIRANYHLEMFTFLQFGFQVFYYLVLERSHFV
jgi:hypothetical protein